ncbi:MAG: hypothetical protein JWQ22_2214 [Devosia sp.]|nr:hypothetical protein [Devosia sp.]
MACPRMKAEMIGKGGGCVLPCSLGMSSTSIENVGEGPGVTADDKVQAPRSMALLCSSPGCCGDIIKISGGAASMVMIMTRAATGSQTRCRHFDCRFRGAARLMAGSSPFARCGPSQAINLSRPIPETRRLHSSLLSSAQGIGTELCRTEQRVHHSNWLVHRSRNPSRCPYKRLDRPIAATPHRHDRFPDRFSRERGRGHQVSIRIEQPALAQECSRAEVGSPRNRASVVSGTTHTVPSLQTLQMPKHLK